MSRRLAVTAILAISIFTPTLRAQCTISVTASGPDANGTVTYHVDAAAQGCANATLTGARVWLDSDTNALPNLCNFVQTCSYDDQLNTYCWTPGVTHTFIAGCGETGNSCPPNPPRNYHAATFTTAPGTKPSLSISYDNSNGRLTKTWAFTEGPPRFAANSQYFSTFINGVLLHNSTPGSYETYTPTGSDEDPLGLGTCGGDRFVAVFANECLNTQPGNPYWSTEKDLTIPDPGQPGVWIAVVPDTNDPTKFDAVVTYHFPTSGTRTLMVKLLNRLSTTAS